MYVAARVLKSRPAPHNVGACDLNSYQIPRVLVLPLREVGSKDIGFVRFESGNCVPQAVRDASPRTNSNRCAYPHPN